MTSSPADMRAMIALALAALAALLAGVMLSTPTSIVSVGVVGLMVLALASPVLIHWHRLLLFWSWNAAIQVFVLPGNPSLWMLMAGLSLGLTIAGNALDRRSTLQSEPTVTWTLLVFLLVVLVTAQMRGGIGIKALGSQVVAGGKKYVVIAAAVTGYFAISSVRVPMESVNSYLRGYLWGSLTLAMSNFAFWLGPAFYWMFLLFPSELATDQAAAEFTGVGMVRLNGIAFAMIGPFCWMLMKYGVRGFMNWQHPWRAVFAGAIVIVSMLGGFRSLLALYILLVLFQFTVEGLWRTRYAAVLACGVLLAAATLPFVRQMPLTVQRSLSFLPIPVEASARVDAEASSEWRFQMWRLLWAQVPDYLLVGKGYALDQMDLYLAQESQRRGFSQSYETAMIAGNYHSGPLSLLISLGLPGTFAFLAFLWASLGVLRRNFEKGSADLQSVNAFLYAYFLSRVAFFFLVFGDLAADLAHFTGTVGVSIALNGVAQVAAKAPTPVLRTQAA
jgi:O-antigen ligase